MPEKGTLAMLTRPFLLRNVGQFVCTLLTFLADGLRYLRLCLCRCKHIGTEFQSTCKWWPIHS
jgi:hypothetical protein